MSENQETRKRTSLSEETGALLRTYFDAFANLYGIMPLYRAFRIIQKQNPELALTEEDILSFADEVNQEDQLYIIAGAEDIYEDVEEPAPPMKREIVAEYLYAIDDFESYEELKAEQKEKPYYIPEKEELLQYADDCYVEETKEALALGQFLRNKLKLKRADDVLSDLQLTARFGDCDPQIVISDVERLAGRGCFPSMEQLNEFFRYYFDLCNHTRMPANRGFTAEELQEKFEAPPRSAAFGPNASNVLQTRRMGMRALRQGKFGADVPVPWKTSMLNDLQRTEQKKPGRNAPCPCGSGKKYKRCCGR